MGRPVGPGWSCGSARCGDGAAPTRVTLHRPFTAVTRTDLLERDRAPLPHDGGSVTVALRPFELVTLRFA